MGSVFTSLLHCDNSSRGGFDAIDFDGQGIKLHDLLRQLMQVGEILKNRDIGSKQSMVYRRLRITWTLGKTIESHKNCVVLNCPRGSRHCQVRWAIPIIGL